MMFIKKNIVSSKIISHKLLNPVNLKAKPIKRYVS